MSTRWLWLGLAALSLLGAAAAQAWWPVLANLLVPAGAWCLLKGLT